MHIVYLHGFNSGPQSLKAAETAAFLAQEAPEATLHCPQLSPHPAEAIALAGKLVSELPEDTLLIGSSLGGYYAGFLAERLQRRAVLINPAIRPYDDLARFLGPQTNPYTGEQYLLTESDMDALLALRVAEPTVARYWLLLGTADEVLDWREAAQRYAGSRQTVYNGDDHRLKNWPQALPGVLAWARQDSAS